MDPNTLDTIEEMPLPAAPAQRQPVPGLHRRRLLLPRQPRPRGTRHHRPAHPDRLGRQDVERSYDIRSAVPSRRRRHLDAARLVGADLVRHQERRGRLGRPAARAPCAAARWASRSATRSRSTRRTASTSSPTERCTASRRAATGVQHRVARGLRQHRPQEAGPDPAGARAPRPRCSATAWWRSPTTPTRSAWWSCAAGAAPAAGRARCAPRRCSTRAPAPTTSP